MLGMSKAFMHEIRTTEDIIVEPGLLTLYIYYDATSE